MKRPWVRSRREAANPRAYKENPMSLGVLNNLSAIYAENNLNNTSSSLNTVLQQLSSGSKIKLRRGRCSRPFAGRWPARKLHGPCPVPDHASEGVGLLTVG